MMRAIQREFRVNERIRAREVRLIDENGVQLGVVPIREAMNLARQRELDLIEVAPQAVPPVCRIMDYGKYKYEQGKREREGRKKARSGDIKGIQLRPYCDEHDFAFKLNNTLKFLRDGNKVKFTVIFRSRQITHPEFARRLLDRIVEATADLASVERTPTMEGRTMTMILTPKHGAKPAQD